MNFTKSVVTGFLIVASVGSTVSSSCISGSQPIKLSDNHEQPDQKNNYLNQEYIKLLKKLYSYKELAQNWDGYDGIKPAEEIIKTAEIFLTILKSNQIVNPKIMVSGDGTVGLFWKNNRNYLEVDFDTAEHLSFFYEFEEKVYGEDDLLVSNIVPENLLNALNKLQNSNNTARQYNGLIAGTDAGKRSTKSFIKIA